MSKADELLREACAQIAQDETEALQREMDMPTVRQAEALYQRHQKEVVALLNRQMRRRHGIARFLSMAACLAVIAGAVILSLSRNAPDQMQPLTPGGASVQPYYTDTPIPSQEPIPEITPTSSPENTVSPSISPTIYENHGEILNDPPTPFPPPALTRPTAASAPIPERTPNNYPDPYDPSTAVEITPEPTRVPVTPEPTPALPTAPPTASPVPTPTAPPTLSPAPTPAATAEANALPAMQGYIGWTGAYVNFPGYLPQGCAVRQVEREEDCTHALLGPADQPDAIQFYEYASTRTLAASGQPLQVAYVQLTGPAPANGTAPLILALQETYPDGAVSLTWDQDGRTYRLAAQTAYAEEIFTMASRLERVQNKTYLGEE